MRVVKHCTLRGLSTDERRFAQISRKEGAGAGKRVFLTRRPRRSQRGEEGLPEIFFIFFACVLVCFGVFSECFSCVWSVFLKGFGIWNLELGICWEKAKG